MRRTVEEIERSAGADTTCRQFLASRRFSGLGMLPPVGEATHVRGRQDL